MTVVHYLNQFFAGLGGEEAAGHEPVRIEGAPAPGGLVAAGLEIDVTLACGDDRFGEHEEESLARSSHGSTRSGPTSWSAAPRSAPDGTATRAASLAREAGRRGIPVVSGMTPDSPGVIAAEGAAYIVPTGPNVASMRTVLPVIASLATRLAAGEPVGSPGDEGYLPRGLRPNVRSDRTGAQRAIDLLLAKIGGDVRTEVEPRGDRVPPPPAVADLTTVKLALVTEAGCVPQGNPDRLPTRHANVWLRYPLGGVNTLASGAYESVHAGSTRPPRTPTRTGWCRSTPCVNWKPTAGSARCMTCSTRRRASTRPWPHRRSSAARSRRSCGMRASRP